ncbi:424_t:CDS:2, partial [Cetraspora pellucida]
QQTQQMMLQMRRPVQNTAPSQSAHRSPHSQKQPNDSNSKKPQQQAVKPYEPAPDLTLVQKEYLEQYVRRDNLYQKALDLQHRRQMSIINEKRKEIAQVEQRYQYRSSPFVFGPGYQGYGNDIAQREDILVPIRLEIDGADGYKLRDTFTWNMNETFITPEHFAEVLCDDLHFPTSQFAPIIVKQIRDQLQGYIIHPLSSPEPSQPSLTAEVFSALKNSTEDTKEIKDENESNYLNSNTDESNSTEELRILIKANFILLSLTSLNKSFNIDVTVGNISLVDQFEWDINCQKNDPELFAEILTTELGLGGEFKTAIAHSIREQIQIYVKSLILVGHPFDGSPIQDDDLRQNFLPP